jgi:uncharacterized membrane protein
MTAQVSQDDLQARIAALEDQLASTIETFGGELGELDSRVRRFERSVPAMSAGGTPAVATPGRRSTPWGVEGHAAPGGRPAPSRRQAESTAAAETAAPPRRAGGSSPAPIVYPERSAALEDLIGGRVLAWVGGVATLLGIALFLALAISHGWIGEEARVLLAGAVSLTLLAGGTWLHDRRGRTEAAIAMVGAAVAGLFATLVVASAVYGLTPGLAALAGALAVGAIATRLAIRWAGRAVAGIGLVGALAAPALVGAPAEWPALAMMIAAAGFAMFVAARQRWSWLTLATVAVCAPQWAVPMLEGQSVGEDLSVLIAFAALGLAGAVACCRDAEDGVPASALAALVLSAAATALVGRLALAEAGGETIANVWLAALAAVHLGLGASRRPALAAPLRATLLSLGLVLANVAFAVSFDGLVLVVGWSASAVLIAALARSPRTGPGGRALGDTGVALQLSLALARTLISAPPSTLLSGEPQLAGIAAVASFACACLLCARFENSGGRARAACIAAGLAALAYLTAATLDGAALAAAWASEAAALLELARRRDERLARTGGLAFAVLASAYTLIAIAPPSGLGGEAVQLGSAAIALAALGALAWRAGRLAERGSSERSLCSLGAGAAALYMASLAVVTLPNGQVLLSALWVLTGVLALVGGLRASSPALRNAALGLLMVTIAKVFLYDLSTLESIARVVSFMVLGLLLLAGAFAYQRLRPPPPPDLREVHPSQR